MGIIVVSLQNDSLLDCCAFNHQHGICLQIQGDAQKSGERSENADEKMVMVLVQVAEVEGPIPFETPVEEFTFSMKKMGEFTFRSHT